MRKTIKGPQIVVSRTHPGLVRRLFELEVPEIADGVVELKACAREPGQRTKIAVWSNDANIDPVGACVGARGARVRQVVNELRGEKIDIVPFSEDREDFVMKALQPARVKEVRIDEARAEADVIVPDQQLSLAIGKEGQNARLASRLAGLRIDIRSETDIAEQEAYEEAYGGDSWADGEWITDRESGEQMWQPADGSPPMTIEQWEASQAGGGRTEAERVPRPSTPTPRQRWPRARTPWPLTSSPTPMRPWRRWRPARPRPRRSPQAERRRGRCRRGGRSGLPTRTARRGARGG